jgi:hypothetical protein
MPSVIVAQVQVYRILVYILNTCINNMVYVIVELITLA